MRHVDRLQHKMRMPAIVVAVLYAASSFAQLNILWERAVGGDNVDHMLEIVSLTDDEFLISYSSNHIPEFRAISKYSMNGMLLGSSIVPDSVSSSPISIVPPHNIALRLASPQDSSSIGLFSTQGDFLWRSDFVFGGLIAFEQYTIGGLILASNFRQDFDQDPIISRIDNYGNLIWSFWDNNPEYGAVLSLASNPSGIIFAPISGNNWNLRKYDPSGTLIDEYMYPYFGSANETILLPDGLLFLTGLFRFDPDINTIGVQMSPDGEVLATYVPPEIEGSVSVNVYPLPDGGYLSSRYVPDENIPVWIGYMLFTKYDASWSIVWEYEYYHFGFLHDITDHKLLVSEDGSFVMLSEVTDIEDHNVFLTRLQLTPYGLEVAAEPLSQTNAVPAPGRFFWHGTLTNNTDSDITTDVWMIVRGPDGYPSEPLRVWQDITVPANGTYEASLRQNVPADAALGEYNYIVRCGEYIEGDPQHTIQAYFPLTIVSGWIPPAVINGRTVDGHPGGVPVNLDPPRTRGVVPAPFAGPDRVQHIE